MSTIFAKIGVAALVMIGSIATSLPQAHANDLSAYVQQVSSRSRGFCTGSQAESRARGMGLSRVRVVSLNSRWIVVEGRDRRNRLQRVTFWNERGCPLARR
ncbi:hypothetical protein [Rhizobium sp. RAF56]|jgi:hypothetical protein|uniref:hypothetical protein n=1 Tax=Rhizobium sp. RAF56 TaxID=3233062 RepID=UPI003F967B18